MISLQEARRDTALRSPPNLHFAQTHLQCHGATCGPDKTLCGTAIMHSDVLRTIHVIRCAAMSSTQE